MNFNDYDEIESIKLNCKTDDHLNSNYVTKKRHNYHPNKPNLVIKLAILVQVETFKGIEREISL